MLSEPGAPGAPDVELTDRQRKEIAFNDKKVLVAKIEAYLAGHLTQDEIDDDPDILHATLDHMEKVAKNQKRRLQMKTHADKIANTKKTLINGCAIYWTMTPPASSLGSAHRLGAYRVHERVYTYIYAPQYKLRAQQYAYCTAQGWRIRSCCGVCVRD